MNFTTFLDKATDFSFFNTKKVMYFYGIKNYPLLFFSLFFKQAKKSGNASVQSIDFASNSDALVASQLETSFLGQSILYWCKNVDGLTDKKKKQWLSYAQGYSGPNSIALFLTDLKHVPGTKNALTVRLSDTLDKKTFLKLLSFFDIQLSARSNNFVKQLFLQRDVLSLDTACVFMYYAMVVGTQGDAFISSWLDKLVIPEASLFTLSQHFFAKNTKQFMKLWARLAGDYPAPFWVAFWSEQTWRAYHFVKYSQSNKFADAKKIGFRLPFSFMQRDWRKNSTKELKQAHDALYAIDHDVKNSAGTGAFDLFFSKYFLKQFAS